MNGSALYDRTMDWAARNLDQPGVDLQHKVWDGTPWMVSVNTGSTADARDREIFEWCLERWGREAWPIHGRDGRWQRGGATVYGWTWFGFATEEMMDEFKSAWECAPDVEEAA